ncbi:MAG: 2-amino-4-hydroxy-6-hydroxymethyldihydropteridine diphosphokinase [Pseudomonadota bacterium]
MPTETFIAIGSNIGDSKTIVKSAIKSLGDIKDSRMVGRSSLYLSEAVSDIEQDDYINAVVKLETGLQPMALLLELQAIEHAFYRRREAEQRWGPRTLDLDIILYGNVKMDDSHLTIPHPEFHNRQFVLLPMLEIDGDQFIAGYGSLQYLADQAEPLKLKKLDTRDD